MRRIPKGNYYVTRNYKPCIRRSTLARHCQYLLHHEGELTVADAVDTILSDARKAIVKRERLVAQLRQTDLELSRLTQRYREEAKVWITSPVMLRHAVEARIGKKLAA